LSIGLGGEVASGSPDASETSHRLVGGVLATMGTLALGTGLTLTYIVPTPLHFLTSLDVVWIGVAMVATGAWVWRNGSREAA
jgi:hypothetical protein